MNTEDFVKYVLDNLGRATLSNALNIANKLDDDKYYKLSEFLDALEKDTNIRLSAKKLDALIAYKIIIAIDTCRTKSNSEFKYNMAMVKDDLIISLWEAINGYKTSED